VSRHRAAQKRSLRIARRCRNGENGAAGALGGALAITSADGAAGEKRHRSIWRHLNGSAHRAARWAAASKWHRVSLACRTNMVSENIAARRAAASAAAGSNDSIS